MAALFDRLEPEHTAFIVPMFEYRGERDTLARYYDKRHAEVDWPAYLRERTKPQPPVAR
jgi:hypothetical protein